MRNRRAIREKPRYGNRRHERRRCSGCAAAGPARKRSTGSPSPFPLSLLRCTTADCGHNDFRPPLAACALRGARFLLPQHSPFPLTFPCSVTLQPENVDVPSFTPPFDFRLPNTVALFPTSPLSSPPLSLAFPQQRTLLSPFPYSAPPSFPKLAPPRESPGEFPSSCLRE
ncbi:hypothetical protein HPB50_021807 [Hyalomma asiaticum]|uniref:Uncharacterized protein n=1 Tax=Hyalomma asiaticum TaxID=266040 RepID=A0ACB7RSH8_HYAAI|nr:hypothetical protein HPB50_021807 [Hyalomma asiaticum]